LPLSPRGAKTKFSKAFVEALTADFLEHKDEVIRIVRLEDPIKYFQVCASLVPKEMLLGQSDFSDMSDDDLAELLAYVQALREGKPVDDNEEAPLH
jgi:hypothetical protein